jgi:hypothetical protein
MNCASYLLFGAKLIDKRPTPCEPVRLAIRYAKWLVCRPRFENDSGVGSDSEVQTEILSEVEREVLNEVLSEVLSDILSDVLSEVPRNVEVEVDAGDTNAPARQFRTSQADPACGGV